MLTYLYGNPFDVSARALINPVDLSGALNPRWQQEISQRCPQAVEEYRQACRAGLLQPGSVLYCHYRGERGVLHWAIVRQWSEPPPSEWLAVGLIRLEAVLRREHILSVAVSVVDVTAKGFWQEVKRGLQQQFDLGGALVMLFQEQPVAEVA